MRIAMWSGPRNLSTAMMYAFGNRADCAVWDEPFYAPYLAATGLEHPMADEILDQHENDPKVVADQCIDTIPDKKPHFYMKHMPHHMIDGFPLDWASQCINVHLIRHPARVIASYHAKRDDLTLDDIGFVQQVKLRDEIGGFVVDSAEIRNAPDIAIPALCDAVGMAFDPAMLTWPKGPRPFDGVWAKHWYGSVHESTGFAPEQRTLPNLTGRRAALCEQAMPFYDKLKSSCLPLT